MITDRDLTFICHVRIDNRLRRKNLWAIYAYYKNHLPNCRFIFVVDDVSSSGVDAALRDGDSVIHYCNDHVLVEKCTCYNIGARAAQTDILVFLDIDIIVDCEKLLACINEANEDNLLECLIGYNRTACYMTYVGEQKFLKTLDVKDLEDAVKELPIKTGATNQNAQVGNTAAVGGCLVMTKKAFETINGFNPFFKGWGYEDNEIISRARILGVNVTKSGDPNHVLFHLPHLIGIPDKSKHPHYKQNEAIAQFVESLNKKQLQQYIRQW